MWIDDEVEIIKGFDCQQLYIWKSSGFEKDETILLERVVLTGGPTVSRELEGCEGLRARKQTHR